MMKNNDKEPEWEYRLIDNNWTKHPVAYCEYKEGYLTEGLIKTHRCRKRKCDRLNEDSYEL